MAAWEKALPLCFCTRSLNMRKPADESSHKEHSKTIKWPIYNKWLGSNSKKFFGKNPPKNTIHSSPYIQSQFFRIKILTAKSKNFSTALIEESDPNPNPKIPTHLAQKPLSLNTILPHIEPPFLPSHMPLKQASNG